MTEFNTEFNLNLHNRGDNEMVSRSLTEIAFYLEGMKKVGDISPLGNTHIAHLWEAWKEIRTIKTNA